MKIRKYYRDLRCCGLVAALHTVNGTRGGLNKALQLTIERNGTCDLTMNGTLSIAKLALTKHMHRLGVRGVQLRQSAGLQRKETEGKKKAQKQHKLTH